MEKDDLVKQNQYLKDSVDFKSDLIATSAHQIRTALSATKWVLKMFLDGDLGALSEEQKTFLIKTDANNERILEYVSEMISVNEANDTETVYDFAKEDIVPIIKEVVEHFEVEALRKKVVLVCNCEEKTEVEIDKKKFITIVQGLVENAIKYNKEGGLVVMNLEKDTDGITFSVQDQGIGISEDESDKIFEKFFRTKTAKKKEHLGSGLGLFMIKRIVEKHNGKIWFESKVNKGSTFFITLPFSQ